MRERRQYVRLDTRLEVTYRVLGSSPASRPSARAGSGPARQAVTKDIGGGGICLLAEEPLAPGTLLEVSIALPGRAQPVVVTGEIVWGESFEFVGQTRQDRAIEVGVKFMEIAPADRDAIMQYVILTLTEPSSE